MNIKNNLKNYWLWLIFAIFLFLIIVGFLHHEPWRDEAQSWLIVRDLNPWQMIRQMPYEGQPPLWHILLLPLVKLGLPYASQGILHLILSSLAIWIFLFFSPFPKLFKFILPFSYYFLFEYAIIARNYVLVILFLFLIASLYKQRFKRPWLYVLLISLLALSSIHALAPALLLAFEFIYGIIRTNFKEKRFLYSTFFLVFIFILIIFMLLPYAGQQYGGLHINNPITIINSLSASLFPFSSLIETAPWYLKAVLSLCWLPLLYLLSKKETLYFWLGSAAWLEFIFIFKNQGFFRHFGLVLVFFIFALWINFLDQNKKHGRSYQVVLSILALIMLINIVPSIRTYSFDCKYYFSGAKEMAEYIKEQELDRYPLVSYPSYLGSSLLPFLPKQKIYQLDREEYGTFLTWDRKFMQGLNLYYSDFKDRLVKEFSGQEVLFIANWPANMYDKDAELIFSNTQPVYTDENFSLFKYNLK